MKALVLALDLALCLTLTLALTLTLSDTPGPCAEAEEGTDLYYERLTGEEIDLSIQDEADTATSQTREEVTR